MEGGHIRCIDRAEHVLDVLTEEYDNWLYRSNDMRPVIPPAPSATGGWPSTQPSHQHSRPVVPTRVARAATR